MADLWREALNWLPSEGYSETRAPRRLSNSLAGLRMRGLCESQNLAPRGFTPDHRWRLTDAGRNALAEGESR
jgi:hypothetical protein